MTPAAGGEEPGEREEAERDPARAGRARQLERPDAEHDEQGAVAEQARHVACEEQTEVAVASQALHARIVTSGRRALHGAPAGSQQGELMTRGGTGWVGIGPRGPDRRVVAALRTAMPRARSPWRDAAICRRATVQRICGS